MKHCQTTISSAFYAEAAENFCAAKLLFKQLKTANIHGSGKPGGILRLHGSSLFMLLQMTMEKLAKAAYSKQQGDRHLPPTTHDMTVLMNFAMRNPALQNFFEKSNQVTYSFLLEELNPLQPSNAKEYGENLEYPWLTPKNSVKYPARDLHLIQKYLANPHNRNLELILLSIEEFIFSFKKIMRTGS